MKSHGQDAVSHANIGIMRLNEGPQKRPRITSSEPEYGDARDVQRIFGLKEALLYLLDRDGQVKSVSITVDV
jgi:hypothetical protein